jgi:hypothetical protein
MKVPEWQARYVSDVINGLRIPLDRRENPKELTNFLYGLCHAIAASRASETRGLSTSNSLQAEAIRVLTEVDVFAYVPR